MRLGIFVGVFGAVAAWEVRAPRCALTVSKALRWRTHLGLLRNTALLRMTLSLPAAGTTACPAEQGWGLLTPVALTAGACEPACLR